MAPNRVPACNDGSTRMLSFVQSSSETTSLAALVVAVVSVVFEVHEGGFCCALACPTLI
jgi:hypothetical protein